jgi:hypothetical protein
VREQLLVLREQFVLVREQLIFVREQFVVLQQFLLTGTTTFIDRGDHILAHLCTAGLGTLAAPKTMPVVVRV